MAKKTKKERGSEILEYRIEKEKQLAKDWKKFGVSQHKIDRIEAKQARHEAEKVAHDAS